MAIARSESGQFKGPVVVLADKDKEEMDELVAEELEDSGLQVITRSGNPAKPAEQRRASAAAADTVVLLWPSGLSAADGSAQQAAVLSALKTAGGVAKQKVVVQSAGTQEADYNAAQVCFTKFCQVVCIASKKLFSSNFVVLLWPIGPEPCQHFGQYAAVACALGYVANGGVVLQVPRSLQV
eukprot:GHRR01035236.1.p1 GENE.GHRR01035236.1~~GHRR01035236.1.p1  ORF type:complete len:182 (+),score=71.26 GHRR01035236.1:1269-1814(+)